MDVTDQEATDPRFYLNWVSDIIEYKLRSSDLMMDAAGRAMLEQIWKRKTQAIAKLPHVFDSDHPVMFSKVSYYAELMVTNAKGTGASVINSDQVLLASRQFAAAGLTLKTWGTALCPPPKDVEAAAVNSQAT